MSAIKAILDSLDKAFAEQDKKVVEETVQWGLAARDRINKAREERRTTHKDKDVQAWYKYLFGLVGGKTNFQMLDGYSTADLAARWEKIAKKTIEARNHKIAKKLNDAGITEVHGSDYSWTKDGFNGVFRVETSSGPHVVLIDSILAGGYNIQCLHQRVLVKVKPAKAR